MRYSSKVHYIQRKILGKLLYAESLPYSAMRPEGIESNHFAYHLEQLIKAGLVIKEDTHYTLSVHGLQLIDRMSQEKMTDRLQPHIVTAIDITTASGQTLLFKRKFQPYINRLGFPLGKIHYEENLLDAANRELKEKTGLKDIPLIHRGMIYITAVQGDQTISKIACHVFQGYTEDSSEAMPDDEHRGECFWLDHTTLNVTNVMPGFFAIKKHLETSKKLFFDEVRERL